MFTSNQSRRPIARRPAARQAAAARAAAAVFEPMEVRWHCDADNSLGSAADLGAVGTYVSKAGSISKSTDASDFYKFTVPSGSKVFKLKLTGLSNDANLYFYDSGKSQTGSSKLTGTNSETITKAGLSAGTYYAEVRAVSGSGNYTLKLDSDFTGDTQATARDVGTLGTTAKTYGEYVGTLDTADYFKFKVAKTSSVTAQLTGLGGDADLELYNSGGTSVGSSKNGGTSAENVTQTLAAGTYYARVTPYLSTTDAKYTLKLTAAPQATEPGATLATAKDFGTLNNDDRSYADQVGPSDTADLFKFKFNKTGLVQLSLGGLSSDADLQLLDSNGNVLSKSIRAGTADENLIKGITAGTYYVKVAPFASDTPATSYQLSVSTSDGAYDSQGNTIADAYDTYTPAPGNGTATGYIVNGQDQDDYFKVHVSQPGNLTAFAYHLSDDLDLRVYDTNGNLVKSALSTSTSSESISYAVPSAGDYYLRVSQGVAGATGSASEYDLQFHVPTDEAGNGYATATPVSLPYGAQGQVGGFDGLDFYKFTVPDDVYLLVSAHSYDNAGNVLLYGTDGNLLDAKAFNKTSDGSFSYFIHGGGTYTVGLVGSSSHTIGYFLTVKTQAF